MMETRYRIPVVVAVAGGILLLAAYAVWPRLMLRQREEGSRSHGSLTLTSPAFADNGPIPAKYTCDGLNISPPLSWSGVPAGAKGVALTVEDTDAPLGTFTQWSVWNLSANLTGLAEGFLPVIAVQGTNGSGKTGYTGPCPPSGNHHYVFTLYAVDRRIDLPSGAAMGDVMELLNRSAIVRVTLTGRYAAK
jgi:Raf kinase inhibitor-like YbhB/YbcL family protein